MAIWSVLFQGTLFLNSDGVFLEKKEETWLSPETKNPYTHEESKSDMTT